MLTPINNKDETMKTAGDRLSMLIDMASRKMGRRLTDRALSRALKVSPTVIGKWRSGTTRLSDDRCVQLANYFQERHAIDVTWRWIRDGDAAERPQADYRLLHLAILAVNRAEQAEGVHLNPLSEIWADVVSNVYNDAQEAGSVRDEFARSQVRLAGRNPET